jgi:hypothetical protein
VFQPNIKLSISTPCNGALSISFKNLVALLRHKKRKLGRVAKVALERLLTKCLYGNVYCDKSSLMKKRLNDF